MAGKPPNKMGLMVEVRNNNVEKACRILSRKVKMEGIIKELRARQYYEKPSVKRRRKHAEAVRRSQKAIREASLLD